MTKKHNAQRRIAREAKTQWVTLGLMRVSPVGQRRFRQAWADEILTNFALEELRKPTVSKRGGHYYIIDGQHRIAALKKWLGEGWESQQVECEVYDGLTEQEEADKFDLLNNVKVVNAFDRFRVRIAAGRPVETHINEIVKNERLVISAEKVPGRIMAVGALRNIYTRAGAETLARSLRIIRDAYGDAGLEAAVIDGIGHLCQRYNGQLEEETAVSRLSTAHGGVSGLLAKAETLRKQTGQPKAHCVAAAAVDTINAKRGGKKLPSWWKMKSDEDASAEEYL